MEQEKLNEILKLHRDWLAGIEGGKSANLRRADLSYADLSGADLSYANLSGANLSEADLSGADLSYANLSGANLSYADLSGANLSEADLSDADLRRANLRRADLSYADLSGANLSDADLRRADLSDADLSGANLSDADLSGADLSDTDLSGADGLLSSLEFVAENFDATSEGIIAYKTFGSSYKSPDRWKIEAGSIIEENVNPNRADLCGCGINVAPLDWVKKNCSGDIWEVLIWWEWLPGVVVPYNTDGKIRCERVQLVKIVER